MNAYIVTEGAFDKQLLEKVLAEEVRQGLKIVSASGKSGAQSLARSLVAERRVPVGLVLDADTTTERLIREQRLVASDLLAMASPGIPTRVFMAVPTIEILFFTDRGLLDRLVGGRVSAPLRAAGKFNPKGTLGQIVRGARTLRDLSDIMRGLKSADAQKMRRHPLIREIMEFLEASAPASTSRI